MAFEFAKTLNAIENTLLLVRLQNLKFKGFHFKLLIKLSLVS